MRLILRRISRTNWKNIRKNSKQL